MCVKVCLRRQVLQENCISMYIIYYKYCILVIIVYSIFLFLFYKMEKNKRTMGYPKFIKTKKIIKCVI